jgi:hypothetical protein
MDQNNAPPPRLSYTPDDAAETTRGETRAGCIVIMDMHFADERLRLTNRFCNNEHNLAG